MVAASWYVVSCIVNIISSKNQNIYLIALGVFHIKFIFSDVFAILFGKQYNSVTTSYIIVGKLKCRTLVLEAAMYVDELKMLDTNSRTQNKLQIVMLLSCFTPLWRNISPSGDQRKTASILGSLCFYMCNII